MLNIIKKSAAVFAVFISAICIIPHFSVYRASGASDFVLNTDSSGRTYVSGYKGNGGNIAIPANAEYIGAGAFKNCNTITAVEIPESCIYVGSNAFEQCLALESVSFGGNADIRESAFDGCIKLETVRFKNISAEASVGKRAFRNCFALEFIDLPSKTRKLSEFAFGNCISLTSLTVPEKTTVSDKAVGFMYDEKNKTYFAANGSTSAYIIYNELRSGKAAEWYAPKKGKPVIMLVKKGSPAEKYAVNSEIAYLYYIISEPPRVSARVSADGSITLSWNKVKGASAYRIYQYEGNKCKSCGSTVSSSFRIKGIDYSRVYRFGVGAFLKTDSGEYAELTRSEIITADPSDKDPAKKNKNTPAVLSEGEAPETPVLSADTYTDKITLKWNNVKGASSYRIYIFNKSQNKYTVYKNVTSNRCDVTNLKSGRQYKFKVTVLYYTAGKTELTEGEPSEEFAVFTQEEPKETEDTASDKK